MGELEKIACGPVFERVYNREIDRAGDNYDKQLANLRLAIIQEGWLACLKELGVSQSTLLGV